MAGTNFQRLPGSPINNAGHRTTRAAEHRGPLNIALEVVFQRELDLSRQAGGAGNSPAGGCVYRSVWSAEARRVRHVEGFGPKLQPAAFGDAELLEDREVEGLEAILAQNVRARIAVSELSREDERRCVKPPLDRRVVQLPGTQSVWPLTADANVGAIGRDGRRKRPSAAHSDDALNLPPAEQRVGEPTRPAEQSFAASHGQFVPPTDGQIVRDVEIRKRSLPRRIAASGRRVLMQHALGERVRHQIPEARSEALLELRLKRMVIGRDVLREVIDRAEPRVGPAALNRARAGGGVVGRIHAVQERPLVGHVINLEYRAREKFVLDAEVP